MILFPDKRVEGTWNDVKQMQRKKQMEMEMESVGGKEGGTEGPSSYRIPGSVQEWRDLFPNREKHFAIPSSSTI